MAECYLGGVGGGSKSASGSIQVNLAQQYTDVSLGFTPKFLIYSTQGSLGLSYTSYPITAISFDGGTGGMVFVRGANGVEDYVYAVPIAGGIRFHSRRYDSLTGNQVMYFFAAG